MTQKFNSNNDTPTIDKSDPPIGSQSLYQLLYDQAPYGIFIVNDTNHITDANPSACRLLGYEKQALIGTNITRLIHPLDKKDLLFLTRQQLLETPDSPPLTHRYKKADQDYLYVSVTHRATAVPSDSPDSPDSPGRVLMFQDISEQKQTRAALRESELKYKVLFENAGEAIFFLDAQDENAGQIIDTNESAARMHGYTRNELIGKHITELDGPDDALKAKNRIQMMRNGEWIRGDIMHTRKNGELFPVEISAGIIRLDNHDYILAFDRDISDRTKTHKALEEQLHFLQTLIDTIPSPIFYKDSAGLYMGCNKAFETYTGLSKQNIVGRSVYDIAPKHLADTYRKADVILLGQKEPQIYEASVKYADGSIRDVIFNKAVFSNKDGAVAGMVGIMMDITEKKQAEDERKALLGKLYQAQKLEAIGNLSAGIAHDFNNILSGILGSSQLAKLYINKPQNIESALDRIIKGAHRAADLVQQILTFSRQSDYKKQPLKVSILVKEVLKLIRATLPSTIEIKLKIHSQAMIMADPGRIHQVIMNLCTNAYHAMDETGGVLTVGTDEITVPDDPSPLGLNLLPGNYFVLEVSDTGQGISPEDMDKIFDPYFTRKPPGTGTGLGLSVVHGIVEEHMGAINVLSNFGQGSTFQIFFPVTRTQTAGTKEESPIARLSGTEKIMIVDDEENIRNSTAGLLEDFGYTTISFPDGMDALEAFKKNPKGFDLIITDMTMPGMTGNELAAKILKIRPELPIILCSGYSQATAMANAIKLGIRQVLQKPVNLEEMALMVRGLLDKNQTS